MSIYGQESRLWVMACFPLFPLGSISERILAGGGMSVQVAPTFAEERKNGGDVPVDSGDYVLNLNFYF